MQNQPQPHAQSHAPHAPPPPQPQPAKQIDGLSAMDPAQRQVFSCLLQFREQSAYPFLSTLSSNITFLIKNKVGYNVEARQVSITNYNVSDNGLANMGQIATVAVHKGPGDAQLVLWSKSEANQSAIKCLDFKVEFLLKEAMRDVYAKDSRIAQGGSGTV